MQLDTVPDSTRLLYFDSEENQQECLRMLLSEQGFDNQFDQYSVKKVLGQGGAGQVMLVQHKLTNETFAMKLLPEEGMNADGLAQIKREIALQTRCKHCPNVVRFKEHFQHENLHCIVMERMEGGDL